MGRSGSRPPNSVSAPRCTGRAGKAARLHAARYEGAAELDQPSPPKRACRGLVVPTGLSSGIALLGGRSRNRVLVCGRPSGPRPVLHRTLPMSQVPDLSAMVLSARSRWQERVTDWTDSDGSVSGAWVGRKVLG